MRASSTLRAISWRPGRGGLPGPRGRQAAEDHHLLARQFAGRARRARPLFASKPIEPDVQTNLSGSTAASISSCSTISHIHPLRAAAREAGGAPVHRAATWAPTTSPPSCTPAGGPKRRRSSPATAGCCWRRRQVHGPQAPLVAAGTASKQEQTTRGHAQRASGLTIPRRFRARLSSAQHARVAEEFRRVMLGTCAAAARRWCSSAKASTTTSTTCSTIVTPRRLSTRRATLIAAATRANVSIYGIDVRGLGAGGDDPSRSSRFPMIRRSVSPRARCKTSCASGQDSLRVLADETGGFAAVNTNDIAGAFQRLVDDNSSYYVLGYYPANERRDGRFRKIEVRGQSSGPDGARAPRLRRGARPRERRQAGRARRTPRRSCARR